MNHEQHTPCLPSQDHGTTPIFTEEEIKRGLAFMETLRPVIEENERYIESLPIEVQNLHRLFTVSLMREICYIPEPDPEEVDKITTELIGAENRQLFDEFLKP